jgi:hypothetical protein
VLAEFFLADSRRPVYLVFRPGMDLLPLFVEAIALLPAARRWEVEFTTSFTTLPQGVSCAWRGVLDGSREAEAAERLPSALVIDVCRPLGGAQGGALVHLARTGELRAPPGAGPHEARPRDAIRRTSPTPGHRSARAEAGPRSVRPGSTADSTVLSDLAVRLSESHSLRSDDGSGRRRPTGGRVAVITAACLLPLLLAAGLSWSPGIRRRIGLEPAPSPLNAVGGPGGSKSRDPARAAGVLPAAKRTEESTARGPAGEPALPPPPVAAQPRPPVSPPVAKPAGEVKPPAAHDPIGPIAAKPRPHGPIVLASSLPDVLRSQLGSQARRAELDLPKDVSGPFEILNSPEFRRVAASTASTWEIATRTGSGLGGGFPLARLGRTEAGTWWFEWTKDARNHSTLVEALRDTALKFETTDGRATLMLLRNPGAGDEHPLTIWEKQPILFERLEPRTRSVPWAQHPHALAGTRWKLGIRRWRVVIERADRNDPKPARRVVEPAPAVVGKEDGGARVELERDVIPGEVTLALAIDPTDPGSITVRIDPDRARVIERRANRSARWNELRAATPRDRDGRELDPIEHRRVELRKLRAEAKGNEDEIKALEKEIRELEEIEDIRQVEDLLGKPARAELSVVIDLEVDGSTALEIARIGSRSGK